MANDETPVEEIPAQADLTQENASEDASVPNTSSDTPPTEESPANIEELQPAQNLAEIQPLPMAIQFSENAATKNMATLSDAAKNALSSEDFHAFIEETCITLLGVIDIENAGDRRDTLVAFGLSEEGLSHRLDLAECYLMLQLAYAIDVNLTDVSEEAKNLLEKHAALKRWLTL